jgi:biotin carboxyl carrier protein
LKGYERGEEPITTRPADVLEPELDAAKKQVDGLAADIGDVLTYVLYPTSGMRFLRWKHGLEVPPPETRGKTLEDIRVEDELFDQVRLGGLVCSAPPAPEPPSHKAGTPVDAVAGTPLLSPMPGTVIRYLVELGDVVRAGDGICVLEAMKMENVLPAPEDGTVVAINCQPGEKVQLNQTVAVIG